MGAETREWNQLIGKETLFSLRYLDDGFLASQDALEVMWVSELLSESALALNFKLKLMWPWWVRIPTRDLTDVTLVSEDTDDSNDSDDHDDKSDDTDDQWMKMDEGYGNGYQVI